MLNSNSLKHLTTNFSSQDLKKCALDLPPVTEDHSWDFIIE